MNSQKSFSSPSLKGTHPFRERLVKNFFPFFVFISFGYVNLN